MRLNNDLRGCDTNVLLTYAGVLSIFLASLYLVVML